MRIGLIISISKALLMARWKQTLVAAVGVTFSITMFITLLSFMTGLNNLLDGLILNRTPHVHIYEEMHPSEKQPINYSADGQGHNFISSIKPKNELLDIRNSTAIMKSLKDDSRVLGVSPKVNVQVFYNVGAVDLNGVLNGIDAVEENRLFSFSEYVVEGNYQDLKNVPNSIILGKGAAEQILANVGDNIQITTSKGQRVQLKVVGYFQSGLQDIDKVQSYVSMATAQKLLGESNSYMTDIQVKLLDINEAPEVAKEYRQIYDVEAVDIQTANAQFETGTAIRTLISYAVGITLLIVSGFGIYNILNMMIYEKMDTIAILKATGFSGKDVKRVFIMIALTIGIFGGLFGLFFGFLISSGIDQIPFKTDALPTIKTYPINYDPRYYLIGGIFSVITTYYAGYFPSRKASKVDPVVIIRGK
ncbi:FtsX-like permease family protein [Fluviicola sp.]|jgi:lipoprotein-releasing system permease protein|uniref:ABC transporter permease n=1 Tax=Fluviicola sp. TaxID=1917219 RepID=UPI00281CFBAD|nr:FtsX-like permease family protein [Fluviicola sp.]MDR0802213.1 ABC transporter permease [Fluviicola sp.]